MLVVRTASWPITLGGGYCWEVSPMRNVEQTVVGAPPLTRLIAGVALSLARGAGRL